MGIGCEDVMSGDVEKGQWVGLHGDLESRNKVLIVIWSTDREVCMRSTMEMSVVKSLLEPQHSCWVGV